jgi:hypothetical protein
MFSMFCLFVFVFATFFDPHWCIMQIKNNNNIIKMIANIPLESTNKVDRHNIAEIKSGGKQDNPIIPNLLKPY